MKKIVFSLALSRVAMQLTSCGNYARQQTPEQMSTPFICEGLHVKRAQWDFVDDYGLKIHVDGRCHSGQRHGQFNFFYNNRQLAKTKFVNDREVKTACKVQGREISTNLENCMNMHANAIKDTKSK